MNIKDVSPINFTTTTMLVVVVGIPLIIAILLFVSSTLIDLNTTTDALRIAIQTNTVRLVEIEDRVEALENR